MKKSIDYWELPNYRQIRVKYLPPTNDRGSRISIYEPYRFNQERTKRKTFSYNYNHDSVEQQALEILLANGWHPVSRCSDTKSYCFLCDDWADGDTFKEVTDLVDPRDMKKWHDTSICVQIGVLRLLTNFRTTPMRSGKSLIAACQSTG